MKHIKTFESFSLFKKLFGNSSDSSDTSNNDNEIVYGEKSENVRKLQLGLEKLGFKLYSYGVDSKIGAETMGQLRALFNLLKESRFSSYIDDKKILDLDSESVSSEQQKLVADLADDENVRNKIAEHFSEEEKQIEKMGLKYDRKLFKHINDKRGFLLKVNEICKQLQISNPNWLLAVMYKESGLNPRIVNKTSNATGLIQFMPKTAEGLGTTVEDLKNMNEIEQLDYVYKYFKPFTGKLKSMQDIYAVTFFPASIGKGDDYVFKTKKTSAETIASQNPVIDLNKDGEITKSEFNEYVGKDIPSSFKA